MMDFSALKTASAKETSEADLLSPFVLLDILDTLDTLETPVTSLIRGTLLLTLSETSDFL